MAGLVKITPVKNRLGQKLRQPGGISREAAVEAAGKNVEMLREEFIGAVPCEIAALENILAAGERQNISKEELDAMLRRAGQILTLSGTYGLGLLDEVVKCFCDLAMGMIDKDIDKVAPVAVHLRAMRLVCPGGPELSPAEADQILLSLFQVHEHLGIGRGTPHD